MDEIIKSAREIAMEKIAALGETTEEERLKWKYLPQGEALSARFLKDDCNLLAELSRYDSRAREYVTRGAAETLLRNISLPKNDTAKKTNRRIMDGLKLLKSDKARVENVYSKLRNLFNHYNGQGEQQRQQAYRSLKAEMEAKVQQALQKQLGNLIGITAPKIDVEKQPEFQQEWRRLQNQLDSAYLTHLNEYKQELVEIR